jgi:hypothetical protein
MVTLDQIDIKEATMTIPGHRLKLVPYLMWSKAVLK